jgi:hypothetical protein
MNNKHQYKYETRLNFVSEISKLSLWYAFNNSADYNSMIKILNEQTVIYRLTPFWDGKTALTNTIFDDKNSQWYKVTNSLCEIYESAKGNVTEFEKQGWQLLKPIIKERIIHDITSWPWIPSGYVPYKLPLDCLFGIFAYELTTSGNSSTIPFHIANACMPQSPFKNMDIRAKELLAMIKKIKQTMPNIKNIQCNSWLNNFPPFLKLFPSEYQQPIQTNIKPSYGYNWWGQFISRDGSFHSPNGKILRETNKFPFIPRGGKCTLNNLRTHLEK